MEAEPQGSPHEDVHLPEPELEPYLDEEEVTITTPGTFQNDKVFTSVAYPQSNGQAEVTNWEILRGLRTRLNHAEGSGVDELSSVLWALRTTPKEATDVTPFQLVYGGKAVVPLEVGVESDRVQLYDEGNGEWRLIELDLVDEAQDKVVVQLMAY
ncbi:uncharacterized protein LOC122039038 [Zingiber officinale]|uniref:uncharacterized protein LOC122039038 n=1 Tax=Zingiber officinale TaxID=94328 RepID=UPI001C4D6480|nr:uncharacterized protein LOC122039038 [Zingiber officinale]